MAGGCRPRRHRGNIAVAAGFPVPLMRYTAASPSQRTGDGMEASELAKEQLEQVEEAQHHAGGTRHGDRTARRVAVLIAILAATLAVSEMGEKSSQNAYLTHHIQAADHWAFFQAKNIRSTVQRAAAEVMESLPTSADPQVRQRIDAARADSIRLRDDPETGDGSKQIAELARAEEASREVAFHRYHQFEIAVGALQISIVLASVSVVTRVLWLAYGAAAIGATAALFSFAIWTGLAEEAAHLLAGPAGLH
jgi:hypothetical protein